MEFPEKCIPAKVAEFDRSLRSQNKIDESRVDGQTSANTVSRVARQTTFPRIAGSHPNHIQDARSDCSPSIKARVEKTCEVPSYGT
jgi:hypothetical protein